MISAYQVTHKAVMDESLRAAVAGCMANRGYDTDGSESNIREFAGTNGSPEDQRFADTERCVIDNAQRLFPDLYGVTVIY